MSTLTDRYVHATTRAVPGAQRADLDRELRGEIAEMVEARAGAGDAPEAAEREAIAEMGDPERLAASYAGRPLQLIGPDYFLIWQRLLVGLLLWVPALVATVVAGIAALDGKDVGQIVGAAVGGALQTAVQIAFWTTLVFAFVDRVGKPSDVPEWTPEQLPELPAESNVDLAETLTWVATGVVTVFLLVWQEVRGVIETDAGVRLPVIDSDLWTTWLPFLIVALGAEAAFALVAHLRRRWTAALVVGAAVSAVAFAAPVIWLLLEERLIDPRFVAEITWLGEGDHLANLSLVVAIAVAAVTVGDIGRKLLMLRRSGSENEAGTTKASAA